VTDIQADAQALELSRRLGEAKNNSRQWDDIAAGIRDELLDHVSTIGQSQGYDGSDNAVLVAGGFKVATVSTVTRRTYDYKQVMADHPEIDWESYVRVSDSVQVRLGRIEGAIADDEE
jgi:hypothetical protein